MQTVKQIMQGFFCQKLNCNVAKTGLHRTKTGLNEDQCLLTSLQVALWPWLSNEVKGKWEGA